MARKRWATARRSAPVRTDGTAARLPPPADQVRRLVCALCGRAAKGFGYTHQLRWGEFPSHRFCSMACCEAGGALAQRSAGMIDKTPMEAQAIKDARRPFAEVLVELGLMAPFHDRSAAEIDRLIEACVDGFQESMRRQAAALDPMSDPIPF
ncbi:MAG: DUF6511 domain-containing protein [Elioraea sp.]|nr:DUF6511 domain-containing protein [Elioraea sp.]MDW8399528.1 DUF6511 domain-containing protein [Acetobacteraceae bacterium]